MIITVILKAYVQYLPHGFINQKQNVKTGVHIFTKIKNTYRWKQKKKFFVVSFQKFLIFNICVFSENA